MKSKESQISIPQECQAYLKVHGYQNQEFMFIEEIGELLQGLMKLNRKPNDPVVKANVQEELADVQIMLWQMIHHHGLKEVQVQVSKKLTKMDIALSKSGITAESSVFSDDLGLAYFTHYGYPAGYRAKRKRSDAAIPYDYFIPQRKFMGIWMNLSDPTVQLESAQRVIQSNYDSQFRVHLMKKSEKTYYVPQKWNGWKWVSIRGLGMEHINGRAPSAEDQVNQSLHNYKYPVK